MGKLESVNIDDDDDFSSKYFQHNYILWHNDQLSVIVRHVTEDGSQLKIFC